MIERSDPPGLFYPVPGLYSQVTESRDRDLVFIAGTLAYRLDGSLPETLAEQAAVAVENIETTLRASGLAPSDVLKITIYTTDMQAFLETALERVFGFFGDERPASTLVEISRLANPDMMVEIELVAARRRTDG